MAKAYSTDLRERVIAAVSAGASCHQAADRFGVAPSTAIRWVGRWRKTGQSTPSPMGGDRRSRLEAEKDWLLARLAATPDMTLEDLRGDLARERDLVVGYGTVWRFVRRHGLSFKKTVLAVEQNRADIVSSRIAFLASRAELDPDRLVFIDETWTKTNMLTQRGWAPRGTRLPGRTPHGHWKTFTFLAGLRTTGVTAPCLVDGPINGALFRAYVRKFLVPTLAPGDVVILDNLGSHKSQAVHDAVASAGAKLLFLPPYSPDLNPIEMLFSKMKAMLRRARARTFEGLCAALADILENVTMAECTNYIQAAGYEPT
ncbi:MAG: IS630 family transposase [Pseudomonadota bacterium]